MITLFIAESCPWCLYHTLPWPGTSMPIGRPMGEWAWVGRVYDKPEERR